jgi:hypothetical protein
MQLTVLVDDDVLKAFDIPCKRRQQVSQMLTSTFEALRCCAAECQPRLA